MTAGMKFRGCVRCSKCREPLPGSLYNRGEVSACPGCGAEFWAEVFPALYKDASAGHKRPTDVQDKEASCFYHQAKLAERVCSSCGRFLCALCDIEMGEEHLCPDCLTTRLESGKADRLVTRRTLYDNIALSVAVVPMLFLWPTLITAPIAFYLAVRHWRKPLSLVPRRRFRFVLAMLLSGLQMAGWAAVFISMA